MERVRLVVSDVDGTLVGRDKSLAPETAEAVALLRAHGVRLALVSSRPAHGLDMLLAPLGIDTPRAGFNGAEILGPDDELLSELTIAEPAARAALAGMRDAGLDSWVFSGKSWYLTNPDGHHVSHEENAVRMRYTQVDDLGPHLGAVHKLMGSSTDFARVAKAEADLQAHLRGQATVLRSQSYYLDVTHPDANKGYAALRLAEMLGVAPAEMACIGDMPNDTPMFAVCGTSIAMGNAPAEVKALARHATTRDNDSGGWAEAIERFVLGGAQAA